MKPTFNGFETVALVSFAIVIDFLQVLMQALILFIVAVPATVIGVIPVLGQFAAGTAFGIGFILATACAFFITVFGATVLMFSFAMRGVGLGAWRLWLAVFFDCIPILNFFPFISLGTLVAVRAANGKGGLRSLAMMAIPMGRIAGVASKAAAAKGTQVAQQKAQAEMVRAQQTQMAAQASEPTAQTPSLARSMSAREIVAMNTSPIERREEEEEYKDNAPAVIPTASSRRDSRFVARNESPVRYANGRQVGADTRPQVVRIPQSNSRANGESRRAA